LTINLNSEAPLTSAADIQTFITRWETSGAAERANYQIFLTELCDLIGVDHPEPAGTTHGHNDYVFERVVTRHKNDGDTLGRIDLYKKDSFVLEAKQSRIKGGKKAKVVIQEFSDFQCPFCSRVLPTTKQVMEEYGDKVSITWRNFPLPFHDKAEKAAEAAREVFEQGGSEKFWAYHDILFANQQALTPEDLVKHAETLGGINTAKLKAALDSDKHKATVQADIEAVNKSGARIGTPSFFINGKLLQGAQPYPAFKQAIDKALAEAK